MFGGSLSGAHAKKICKVCCCYIYMSIEFLLCQKEHLLLSNVFEIEICILQTQYTSQRPKVLFKLLLIIHHIFRIQTYGFYIFMRKME